MNLRLWQGLYAPGRKRSLARRRIVFDAVDRLSAQASGLRDLGDAGGLGRRGDISQFCRPAAKSKLGPLIIRRTVRPFVSV